MGNGGLLTDIIDWILVTQTDERKLKKRKDQIIWISNNIDKNAHKWFYHDIQHKRTLYLNGEEKTHTPLLESDSSTTINPIRHNIKRELTFLKPAGTTTIRIPATVDKPQRQITIPLPPIPYFPSNRTVNLQTTTPIANTTPVPDTETLETICPPISQLNSTEWDHVDLTITTDTLKTNNKRKNLNNNNETHWKTSLLTDNLEIFCPTMSKISKTDWDHIETSILTKDTTSTDTTITHFSKNETEPTIREEGLARHTTTPLTTTHVKKTVNVLGQTETRLKPIFGKQNKTPMTPTTTKTIKTSNPNKTITKFKTPWKL